MTRLLPHPWMSLALVLMWLLLNRFSLGHLLLGATIGGIAGAVYARVEPDPPRVSAIRPLVRLAGMVFLDIIRSNRAVAGLMLTNGRHGARRSAFVESRLRLRNPLGLAVLGMIITATPGTAWIEYDAETGSLLIHVFDVLDPDEWRAVLRDRYEALLLEAFE